MFTYKIADKWVNQLILFYYKKSLMSTKTAGNFNRLEPRTNIKILVQNGPKYFLLTNEYYLTGNHWGNIRNQSKMKNKNFQNFIVVTFCQIENIF